LGKGAAERRRLIEETISSFSSFKEVFDVDGSLLEIFRLFPFLVWLESWTIFEDLK